MLRRSLAAAAAFSAVLAGYYVIRQLPKAAPAPSAKRFIGGADDGYVDTAVCASCHTQIAATYRQTGMSRAFYRPRPENMVEDWTKANTYYHKPSDEHYTMIRRGDQYFERRHQLDGDGAEIHVFEQRIDFVMGSGNHARTYLYLDPTGKLTEMPLGWYAEKGGSWGMNPNYDLPQHPGFQREIGFGCMFCHNAYPEVAPGDDASGREPRFRGAIPEGIDCQRCHGPGAKHLEALKSGASVEKIRAAIVNPRRLDPERQLEICMQCHLETTSRLLPHAVVRFDRSVFSFRPGEPLAGYELNFDFAQGQGDRFEIAHMAYRLRKSACFLATAGTPRAMTCTTCHDPHKQAPVSQAVCRQCHAAEFDALVASRRHTASGDCIACHMPTRRTDDVVRVVMTDHYIQRRKPDRNLIAPLVETEGSGYVGEVVLYYPAKLPPAPETELYLAVAQVMDSANLAKGIPRLRQAIESSHPKQAGFYFHLAEALTKTGHRDEAFGMYEAALERSPKHRDAWLAYGVALSKAGQVDRAIGVLERALEQIPDDPLLLTNLGEARLGKSDQQSKALDALRRAVEVDPGLAAARQNLGLAYSAANSIDLAVRAWEEAIRIQPNYPLAHNSLANGLAERGDVAAAESHYRLAIRFDAAYADAHFNYAALLFGQRKLAQAESELREVIRLTPDNALAHNNLAGILDERGDRRGAIAQYRIALEKDPTLDKPHLALGMALGSQGDFPAARNHFEQAVKSADPAVRQAALEALQKIQTLEHR